MVASIYNRFASFFAISGPTMPNGSDLQALVTQLLSSQNSIVAFAGGGQAGATPLTSFFNEIGTVGTASDSVLLPPSIPGTSVVINNAGGAVVQVFGQGSDTIAQHGSNNQNAAATGVAHANANVGWYLCTTAGRWKQTLWG